MILAQECSELVDLTPVRVKQIIKEYRTKNNITDLHSSRMKITHDEVRSLLENRGLTYKKCAATIGAEKGGIGKSLISCNVALKKARRGAKVLVIDLDPEACATSFFLKEEEFDNDHLTILEVFKNNIPLEEAIVPSRFEGLYIIPCRGKARRVEKFVRDENLGQLLSKYVPALKEVFDLILFDVPPTFSNIIASAYLASDIIVMPTFPDSWSLESIYLTMEDIKEASEKWLIKEPEMKILLNKYNPNKKASKEAWKSLLDDFHGKVLPYLIRESADLQNTINDGLSVYDLPPSKAKEVKDSITQLSDFICPLEKIGCEKEISSNNSKLQ